MNEKMEEITAVEEKKLKEVIRNHLESGGTELTLLQDVQTTFGFLPRQILFSLAERLKIPIARFYGVATFYAQFTFQQPAKYHIIICDGTACHIKGSQILQEFIHNELKIRDGEQTDDGLFSLEAVACLGACAIAPSCMINGQVYGNLTIDKLKALLESFKKEKGGN